MTQTQHYMTQTQHYRQGQKLTKGPAGSGRATLNSSILIFGIKARIGSNASLPYYKLAGAVKSITYCAPEGRPLHKWYFYCTNLTVFAVNPDVHYIMQGYKHNYFIYFTNFTKCTQQTHSAASEGQAWLHFSTVHQVKWLCIHIL